MASYPPSLDLDDAEETRVVSHPVPGADDGARISAAGDVNGDGIADLLVSVDVATSYREDFASYVVFGTADPSGPSFDLEALDGSNGFALTPRAGWTGSVAVAAGDLNGDGLDDIAWVSAEAVPGDHVWADVHVVFGAADGHGGAIAVGELDGTTGFTLTGPTDDRAVYYELTGAGDLDGDGYDDLMIDRGSEAGFLFGQAGGFAATETVAEVAPTDFYHPGTGTKAAGDFDGDGYGDLIIGNHIFYGRADDEPAGSWGGPFRDDYSVIGEPYSSPGFNTRDVVSAGDVNGDGIEDFIFSNAYTAPHGHTQGGEAFVVFGREGGLPFNLSLSSLNGANGFVIRGDYGARLGQVVAGGSDINGDGFDDVIVSQEGGDKAFVVYGRATYHTAGFEASELDGRNGFVIENSDPDSIIAAIAGVGDVNGDGFDDLAFGELPGGIASDSQLHLLLGQKPTEPVTRIDGSGDQTVRGGLGDDTLISYGGDDRLIGDAGNDRLSSAMGTDVLEGGQGDDTYFVFRDHSDIIIDSGGTDTISAKTSYDLRLYATIENLEFSTAGNWQGIGNGLDNEIRGSFGANRLSGLDGNDRLFGLGGDDVLAGGSGRDVLEGGTGADRFDFADGDSGLGATRDAILDFAGGVDRINLGAIDANVTRSSNQAFSFVGDAAFSGTAGELRYQQSTYTDGSPLTLVEGDTDGDGSADFQIELRGHHALTPADFIL